MDDYVKLRLIIFHELWCGGGYRIVLAVTDIESDAKVTMSLKENKTY